MAKTKNKSSTPGHEANSMEVDQVSESEAVPLNAENAELENFESTSGDTEETVAEKYEKLRNNVSDEISSLTEKWEADVPEPDFETDVPVDSLESKVGYSSLFRQLHHAYVKRVAYYRSAAGGSLSIDDARKEAFHACKDIEEVKKELNMLMRLPLENIGFIDLLELHSSAPRVAERLWEHIKHEGRLEFESGHLAANITFSVYYMKDLWNIARYLGVRESFISEWKPVGGIEVSLIDMLTQSYFQWQFWLEETVKRSQTREREEDPQYTEWKAHRKAVNKAHGWSDGYWLRPYVSEQEAIEHSVQMADRWNRIYMRTLRQLRDLRRYAPVTINNPNQVNIAAKGGQQVNVSKKE